VSTDPFATWPTTEAGTADQLARFYTTRAMWHYGAAESSHDRPVQELKAATGAFVDGHTIAHLLREWAKTDPERANKATRELLEAYELMPAPLHDLQEWLTEYGVAPDEVVSSGVQAAKERHRQDDEARAAARTPLTADTDA